MSYSPLIDRTHEIAHVPWFLREDITTATFLLFVASVVRSLGTSHEKMQR
jgi:hypothetical protein